MLLLTGKQSKLIDEFTQNQIGIPGLVLMERAALKVAEHVEHLIRTGTSPSGSDAVLAVAGIGNNGADAVAAARILKTHGIHAEALVVGNPEKMTESMERQIQIAGELGVNVEITDPEYAVKMYHYFRKKNFGYLLDGLFGVGLCREITGGYRELIEAINDHAFSGEIYKTAVDVPSGIDCGTGRVLGCAVKCSDTVTFGSLKYGLTIDEGRKYAGEIFTEDIGLVNPVPSEIAGEERIVYRSLDKKDLSGLLPLRDPSSNKGTYGKILIAAGNDDIYGAAFLSAAAAYSMGAGLVKVFTSEKNRDNLMRMLPEAMVSTYTKDDFGYAGKDKLRADIKWADVIVCGPGLGTDDTAKGILTEIVSAEIPDKGKGKTLILDADAINMMGTDRELLRTASRNYRTRVIITPHMLEMSRISGETIEKIRENRGRVARNLAEEYKIAVVLKDARTHMAVWDCDEVFVNLTGNSGMSKGGSGDVLTGILASLLAQWRGVFDEHDIMEYEEDTAKYHFLQVIAEAVYLHGLAGDKAAETKGQFGMLAGDIINGIKEVI